MHKNGLVVVSGDGDGDRWWCLILYNFFVFIEEVDVCFALLSGGLVGFDIEDV
jgi:hypothetical protein